MTRVAVPSLERFLAQATEFRGKGKFCRRFRQKRGNLGVDTGMAPILAILRGSLSQPKEKVGCPGFLDLEPAGWRQVLQIIDREGRGGTTYPRFWDKCVPISPGKFISSYFKYDIKYP